MFLFNMPCSQKRSEMITDNGSGCVYGEGDGCAALAEGNEFILALQKKSGDNRAKNELELYEKRCVERNHASACGLRNMSECLLVRVTFP